MFENIQPKKECGILQTTSPKTNSKAIKVSIINIYQSPRQLIDQSIVNEDIYVPNSKQTFAVENERPEIDQTSTEVAIQYKIKLEKTHGKGWKLMVGPFTSFYPTLVSLSESSLLEAFFYTNRLLLSIQVFQRSSKKGKCCISWFRIVRTRKRLIRMSKEAGEYVIQLIG